MNSEMMVALGYLIFTGLINSAYTLPLKLELKWKWENMWLAFTILGIWILPSVLGMLTTPGFWLIYSQINHRSLFIVALSGATWGIGTLLSGITVDLMGVAAMFTTVMGVSTSVGAILPLILQGVGRVSMRAALLISLGLSLTILGVALCGLAGKQREEDEAVNSGLAEAGFLRGFIFAVLGGICGSMLNFGLVAEAGLTEIARRHGASARDATNAAWAPVLFVGAIPAILFCVHLLGKNQTGANFVGLSNIPYLFLALLMGILWFGSIVLYGWATLRIGALGAVLGWPIFMVTIILGSAIWGVATGEWKNARSRARVFMASSVSVLVVSIINLARANS